MAMHSIYNGSWYYNFCSHQAWLYQFILQSMKSEFMKLQILEILLASKNN